MNDVEGDRAYVSSLAVLDVRRGSRSQSDPIETSRVLCAAYVCGSPPEVSSRQYGTVRRSTHAYTVNPTRNAVEYPLEALRPGACRAPRPRAGHGTTRGLRSHARCQGVHTSDDLSIGNIVVQTFYR